MNTNQPNTPAEQTAIRRAIRLGTPIEITAISNPPDTGWMDWEPGYDLDFNVLRYRIKGEEIMAAAPTPQHFSERELLAIMSAIIFANGRGSGVSSSVTDAKRILHEIDSTPT